MTGKDRYVRRDDEQPPRMKLGNEGSPRRVPREGHEGPVAVDEELWHEHGRRLDTAREHARRGAMPSDEDPKE